jgi:hypothetical protein
MVSVMNGRRGDRVLDLDRATRGHHGGNQKRGHVAGPGGEYARRGQRAARADDSTGRHTARGQGSAAGGGSAARGRAAACPGAPTDTEQIGDHPERPERRCERRQLAADPAYLEAELAAARTIAQMAPGQATGSDPAVVGEDQLLADLRAGGLPCHAGLRQPHPGAHQQRLYCRNRDAQRLGQIAVGHPAELAHQQRRPLLVREALDVGDQSPERLTLLGLGDRILCEPRQMLERVSARQQRAAQLIDAAIVSYAIQPRAQRELAGAAAQPRVGSHEDLLHRVLGILW